MGSNLANFRAILRLGFKLFVLFAIVSPVLSYSNTYKFNADEDGVIYPSNHQVKQAERRNMEYRNPDAEKLRYKPLGNDLKVDPLDETYQEWRDEVRIQSLIEADVDQSYEQFIKEISPLIFSLGDREIEPDLRDLLAEIPANSLRSLGNQFYPEGPISLERGELGVDPFYDTGEPEEEVLGRDINLEITVTDPTSQHGDLLSMAYDALQSGQAEGAASLYLEVLEKEPDNKDALFGLATTYHRIGEYDRARENYIKILKKRPNDWAALNNLMLLAGEEAPIDALKELKSLELINPEFAPIPAQIALIYLRLNKKGEAIKYFSRAIILAPDNLAYRYNLAVIFDHAGHKQQAIRLYKQLLSASRKGKKLPESEKRIRERLAYIASAPIAVR